MAKQKTEAVVPSIPHLLVSLLGERYFFSSSSEQMYHHVKVVSASVLPLTPTVTLVEKRETPLTALQRTHLSLSLSLPVFPVLLQPRDSDAG